MITTKNQRKKLYENAPGYGWIVFNSGSETIEEIEVYVGRDNKLRRCGNGKPLFPLSICDKKEGIIKVS